MTTRAAIRDDSVLSKVLDHYVREARSQVRSPGYTFRLDAFDVQRCAGRVVHQLEVAERKDDTPDLLLVDGCGDTRWLDVIDALLKPAYAALGAATVGSSEQAAAAGKSTTPLLQAFDALDAVRRRLTGAVNGNKPRSEQARELRALLYGGRRFRRTRADYTAEYEHLVAILLALEERDMAPNGVRRMRPLVETALARLKALPPTGPGRPRKRSVQAPVEVQVTTLALNLALGDLLSHAASTATEARLESLNQAIAAPQASRSRPVGARRKKVSAEKSDAAPVEVASPETADEQPVASQVAPDEERRSRRRRLAPSHQTERHSSLGLRPLRARRVPDRRRCSAEPHGRPEGLPP